ncbi:hypothetical protein [Nostoc sp. NMS9]|uniref:hypothetical protein n=1 Tax=Nostoc sp. NMS9 TaxID=2815393 RepID=UPI0025F137F8|nr:hypothetical protein [Nostoc sp. NMS9]MBN3943180.1 hypothetical protein [Nostoc sp. NMS9]
MSPFRIKLSLNDIGATLLDFMKLLQPSITITSLARRAFLKKLIGVSIGTSILHLFGIGNLPTALAQSTESVDSQDITPFNLLPRLEYDYLSPMLKGIGEGVGAFTRGIGEGAGDTARGIGEGIGDVARGIGEGLRERLRDLLSNSEGKRKLYEYTQEQDFKRKRDAQEQDFRTKQELVALMRDSIREFQAKQIELKLTEIQSNWDLENWNGILSRQETEDLLSKKSDTLLILLSPPAISSDVSPSIRNNLELELRGLEAFLAKYYPEQNRQHPIRFYSGYFKRPINDLNVEQLHRVLAPIPTAILYMDITDYACTFRIGFWGIQSEQVSFVASEEWNWENAKKDLMSRGTGEIEALRLVRKMIVSSNKLFASYLADLYYLSFDPYYELQLPKLTAEFVREGLTRKWLDSHPNQLKVVQKQEQQIYDQELAKVVEEAKAKAVIERYADAIKQVLEQDKKNGIVNKQTIEQLIQTHTQDKDFRDYMLSEFLPILKSYSDLADKMHQISLKDCPLEFQQAFVRHNFAWFTHISKSIPNLSDFSLDSYKLDISDISEIEDSWHEVLQIAAKYGVDTEGF